MTCLPHCLSTCQPEVWDTCAMVKSVAVRRMKREAARTMASSAEPYRNGFVPRAFLL